LEVLLVASEERRQIIPGAKACMAYLLVLVGYV
jgi:hypothetical protein